MVGSCQSKNFSCQALACLRRFWYAFGFWLERSDGAGHFQSHMSSCLALAYSLTKLHCFSFKEASNSYSSEAFINFNFGLPTSNNDFSKQLACLSKLSFIPHQKISYL